MVRLGLTTNSAGRRQDGRIPSQPESEQSYPHPAEERIRHYGQTHYVHPSNPRASSFATEESHIEPSSSASHYPSSDVSEVLPAPHNLRTVLNRGAQINHFPSVEWSQKAARPHSDIHSRGAQKQNCPDTSASSSSSSLDVNYTRDIKFCPICRSSVISGTAHQCKIIDPSAVAFSSRTAPVSVSQHTAISRLGPQPLVSSHTVDDKHAHNVPDSDNDHHIQSRLVPNLLPTAQDSSCSSDVSQHEKKSSSVKTSYSSTRSNIMPTPVVTQPVYDVHSNRDRIPSQDYASGGKPSHTSPLWYGNDRRPITKTDAWETPTSLISRLTAGLTASSSQSQQHGEKGSSRTNCPSPSMSEESDTMSFICMEESTQAEDPFYVAHQELMDEVLRGEPHCYSNSSSNSSSSNTSASGSGNPNTRPRPKVQKEYPVMSDSSMEKSQKYAVTDSSSSELMCIDSNQSRESDLDDSRHSERNNQMPDLCTLLKSIKQPTLIPHSPDKSNIHDFLDPEEIGHINHLIKSLSDSVLTISLPDTLYKNKGFTPLDYMDIHLNAVMRQFFFVFKNEDFLNLPMPDQISLLNGCSLRAVTCSGLYLFNKDTGCWYIPGSTNRLNHPVIHISDLLQVYPQHIVSKMYELHTAASKLDFDWSMGVITNCILMYTPIKKIMQDMEKVDFLRNKYVHLLLKYISWKHGQHNSALVFPEILKILDALLLLVDELSVLDLNLSEEEVMAVEERLSTLTLMQLAPLKNQSSRFKEEIDSWSSLKCVTLTEINNRLCMALHLSMTESLRSNTAEYWTSSSVLCTTNAAHDDNALPPSKKLPQIMPPANEKSDKLDQYKENSYSYQKKDRYIGDRTKITLLAERDLMLLRHFLEDATARDNSSLIENIKEKMDAKQIQLIIKKLCS